MILLSVDAGTSLIKTVAFNERGREVACARSPVAITRPRPGWSEQVPEAVWDAVGATVRAVVAEVGSEEVMLIAITGQGDGCWLVDAHGLPPRPAVLWNDARAAAIVEAWRVGGVLEAAFRVNGSIPFAGAQCAILRWLHEHEPEMLGRVAAVLYCKDWITLQMTGEVATDESDASLPFLDIKSRCYSSDLLRLYGVEWATELLPRIRPPLTVAGELRSQAAQLLGLRAGLPVVAAPFDIAATAIGLGAVSAGQAVSILGTTLCTEVVSPVVETDGPLCGMHVCSGLGERWLRVFPTMSGTDTVDWICRQLGLGGPGQLSELAARAEPGAAGVFVLPYLSPAGERAPFLNPRARGTVFGLSLEHGREHLARAHLEGLSYAIRECLESANVSAAELRVCGGGAASEVWCQILADVTGLAVRTSMDREAGAKGAMLVGLVACGRAASVEEAAERLVAVERIFEPRAWLRNRYDDGFQRFLALRRLAAQAWDCKEG